MRVQGPVHFGDLGLFKVEGRADFAFGQLVVDQAARLDADHERIDREIKLEDRNSTYGWWAEET